LLQFSSFYYLQLNFLDYIYFKMTDEELEQLREKAKELDEQQEINKEKAQLKQKINKAEFREKHSKLLKVTGTLEKGTKGFFKGIGSIFKGTIKAGAAIAEAGNKMDAKLAEQQRKEAGANPKKKSGNEINDALYGLD